MVPAGDPRGPLGAAGDGHGPAGLADGPRRPGPVRRAFDLPGDRRLIIRDIQPDDAGGIVRLYQGLDETDLFCRFFGARPPPETFVAQMTATASRCGTGLVATIAGVPATARAAAHDTIPPDAGPAVGRGRREPPVVAEATYALLPDGDGELGITVAAEARGWLGPYLLDALLEIAAAHGVANLQADILVTNGRMLSMLRRRGCAVLDHADRPSIIRMTVGTTSPIPSWAPAALSRRVLVEAPGSRWHGDDDLRAAGYRVMVCSGPPGGWPACPPRHGRSCPLVAGADLVLDAVPGSTGCLLARAHTAAGPRVPVVWVRQDGIEPPAGVRVAPPDLAGADVVALARQLLAPVADRRGRSTLEVPPPDGAQ